jgi:hypothetical protein
MEGPEYKPTKKQRKKDSISFLRDKADKHHSRYVRLRDSEWCSDGVGGPGWYGTCITCSKTGPVAYIDEKGKLRFTRGWDNGHFVSRGHLVVRYEETNVNLQCSFRCNKMRSGEYQKYKAALKLKYGDKVPDELETLAATQRTYKFKKDELLQVIADSKEQIKFYLDKQG